MIVLIFGCLLMIPVMAYIDYHLFGHYVLCDNCGGRVGKHTYLLATTLEILLFMVGVSVGLGWKL